MEEPEARIMGSLILTKILKGETMKYLMFLLVFGCAMGEEKDYKSTTSNVKAFQEERALEQDATTKDQFPTTQPATNQSQSF